MTQAKRKKNVLDKHLADLTALLKRQETEGTEDPEAPERTKARIKECKDAIKADTELQRKRGK